MIGIIIISLLFSALFFGIKTAYIQLDLMQIELERKKKSKISNIVTFLINQSRKLYFTLIIGNIFFSIIFIYSGIYYLSSISLSNISLFHIIFISCILFIFSYFIPHSIFSIFPNTLFKFFSAFTLFFYLLFHPIILIFFFCDKFFSQFQKQDSKNITLKNKDLTFFIEEKLNEDEGIQSEIQFLKNALKFSDLKVRDCMIYRKEIIAIDIEDSISNLAAKFMESGFSKIIVYRDSIDNIIGYVHSFGLLKKPKNIKHILFPIEMVHETTSIREIMNRMIKKSRTIAIVLDEYGGTSGLITLEDIVEELFGNIEDEYDKSNEIEQKVGENHFIFSSTLKIDYVNQKYNLQLPESEEYSTLGGFVTYLVEDIPNKNQKILFKNIEFIIREVSNTRIEELEVKLNFEKK